MFVTIRRFAVILALLAVSGCSFTTGKPDLIGNEKLVSKKKAGKKKPPSGPTRVVGDSTAIALGRSDKNIADQQRFQRHYVKLLKRGRRASAHLLVARNIDHARATLRSGEFSTNAPLMQMAATFDQICRTAPKEGWRAALTAVAQTGPAADYLKARQSWLSRVKAGDFRAGKGMQLDQLGEQTQIRALAVDGLYQHGISLLLSEENAAAAEAFKRAAQVGGAQVPLQTIESMLLLSEAKRRAKDKRGAAEAWRRAVVMSAELLMAQQPIADVSLWDRILYLQPVGEKLSNEVVVAFSRLAGGRPNSVNTHLLKQVVNSTNGQVPVSPRCWALTGLASWQLERGQFQSALIHLKKAEALAPQAATQWFKLAQGQSLIALGQHGMATAIFSQLASHQNKAVSCAAKCSLGIRFLQAGENQRGVAMLKQALEGNPTVHWPGRSSAEADYALAMLVVGEKSRGLSRLHTVQQRFHSEGEVELLAKALWNEKQYHQNTSKDKAAINRVDAKLKSMGL